MKIFRYFMVLVLVVLLLAAAGCGGNTDTGDPSGNQNGGTDENGDETGGETVTPDVKVKVTPPEGWEVYESSALIHYMKGPSSFMVVRDRVCLLYTSITGSGHPLILMISWGTKRITRNWK